MLKNYFKKYFDLKKCYNNNSFFVDLNKIHLYHLLNKDLDFFNLKILNIFKLKKSKSLFKRWYTDNDTFFNKIKSNNLRKNYFKPLKSIFTINNNFKKRKLAIKKLKKEFKLKINIDDKNDYYYNPDNSNEYKIFKKNFYSKELIFKNLNIKKFKDNANILNKRNKIFNLKYSFFLFDKYLSFFKENNLYFEDIKNFKYGNGNNSQWNFKAFDFRTLYVKYDFDRIFNKNKYNDNWYLNNFIFYFFELFLNFFFFFFKYIKFIIFVLFITSIFLAFIVCNFFNTNFFSFTIHGSFFYIHFFQDFIFFNNNAVYESFGLKLFFFKNLPIINLTYLNFEYLLYFKKYLELHFLYNYYLILDNNTFFSLFNDLNDVFLGKIFKFFLNYFLEGGGFFSNYMRPPILLMFNSIFEINNFIDNHFFFFFKKLMYKHIMWLSDIELLSIYGVFLAEFDFTLWIKNFSCFANFFKTLNFEIFKDFNFKNLKFFFKNFKFLNDDFFGESAAYYKNIYTEYFLYKFGFHSFDGTLVEYSLVISLLRLKETFFLLPPIFGWGYGTLSNYNKLVEFEIIKKIINSNTITASIPIQEYFNYLNNRIYFLNKFILSLNLKTFFLKFDWYTFLKYFYDLDWLNKFYISFNEIFLQKQLLHYIKIFNTFYENFIFIKNFINKFIFNEFIKIHIHIKNIIKNLFLNIEEKNPFLNRFFFWEIWINFFYAFGFFFLNFLDFFLKKIIIYWNNYCISFIFIFLNILQFNFILCIKISILNLVNLIIWPEYILFLFLKTYLIPFIIKIYFNLFSISFIIINYLDIWPEFFFFKILGFLKYCLVESIRCFFFYIFYNPFIFVLDTIVAFIADNLIEMFRNFLFNVIFKYIIFICYHKYWEISFSIFNNFFLSLHDYSWEFFTFKNKINYLLFTNDKFFFLITKWNFFDQQIGNHLNFENFILKTKTNFNENKEFLNLILNYDGLHRLLILDIFFTLNEIYTNIDIEVFNDFSKINISLYLLYTLLNLYANEYFFFFIYKDIFYYLSIFFNYFFIWNDYFYDLFNLKFYYFYLNSYISDFFCLYNNLYDFFFLNQNNFNAELNLFLIWKNILNQNSWFPGLHHNYDDLLINNKYVYNNIIFKEINNKFSSKKESFTLVFPNIHYFLVDDYNDNQINNFLKKFIIWNINDMLNVKNLNFFKKYKIYSMFYYEYYYNYFFGSLTFLNYLDDINDFNQKFKYKNINLNYFSNFIISITNIIFFFIKLDYIYILPGFSSFIYYINIFKYINYTLILLLIFSIIFLFLYIYSKYLAFDIWDNILKFLYPKDLDYLLRYTDLNIDKNYINTEDAVSDVESNVSSEFLGEVELTKNIRNIKFEENLNSYQKYIDNIYKNNNSANNLSDIFLKNKIKMFLNNNINNEDLENIEQETLVENDDGTYTTKKEYIREYKDEEEEEEDDNFIDINNDFYLEKEEESLKWNENENFLKEGENFEEKDYFYQNKNNDNTLINNILDDEEEYISDLAECDIPTNNYEFLFYSDHPDYYMDKRLSYFDKSNIYLDLVNMYYNNSYFPYISDMFFYLPNRRDFSIFSTFWEYDNINFSSISTHLRFFSFRKPNFLKKNKFFNIFYKFMSFYHYNFNKFNLIHFNLYKTIFLFFFIFIYLYHYYINKNINALLYIDIIYILFLFIFIVFLLYLFLFFFRLLINIYYNNKYFLIFKIFALNNINLYFLSLIYFLNFSKKQNKILLNLNNQNKIFNLFIKNNIIYKKYNNNLVDTNHINFLLKFSNLGIFSLKNFDKLFTINILNNFFFSIYLKSSCIKMNLISNSIENDYIYVNLYKHYIDSYNSVFSFFVLNDSKILIKKNYINLLNNSVNINLNNFFWLKKKINYNNIVINNIVNKNFYKFKFVKNKIYYINSLLFNSNDIFNFFQKNFKLSLNNNYSYKYILLNILSDFNSLTLKDNLKKIFINQKFFLNYLFLFTYDNFKFKFLNTTNKKRKYLANFSNLKNYSDIFQNISNISNILLQEQEYDFFNYNNVFRTINEVLDNKIIKTINTESLNFEKSSIFKEVNFFNTFKKLQKKERLEEYKKQYNSKLLDNTFFIENKTSSKFLSDLNIGNFSIKNSLMNVFFKEKLQMPYNFNKRKLLLYFINGSKYQLKKSKFFKFFKKKGRISEYLDINYFTILDPFFDDKNHLRDNNNMYIKKLYQNKFNLNNNKINNVVPEIQTFFKKKKYLQNIFTKINNKNLNNKIIKENSILLKGFNDWYKQLLNFRLNKNLKNLNFLNFYDIDVTRLYFLDRRFFFQKKSFNFLKKNILYKDSVFEFLRNFFLPKIQFNNDKILNNINYNNLYPYKIINKMILNLNDIKGIKIYLNNLIEDLKSNDIELEKKFLILETISDLSLNLKKKHNNNYYNTEYYSIISKLYYDEQYYMSKPFKKMILKKIKNNKNLITKLHNYEFLDKILFWDSNIEEKNITKKLENLVEKTETLEEFQKIFLLDEKELKKKLSEKFTFLKDLKTLNKSIKHRLSENIIEEEPIITKNYLDYYYLENYNYNNFVKESIFKEKENFNFLKIKTSDFYDYNKYNLDSEKFEDQFFQNLEKNFNYNSSCLSEDTFFYDFWKNKYDKNGNYIKSNFFKKKFFKN